MKKTGIMTDSHSGILNEEAERLGIKVLPMPFYIEEKVYREGVDLSREEFYDMLRKGTDVSTSQPSLVDVAEMWKEMLKEYEEIVYIPLSSALSGSCMAAMAMANEDEFAGKVFVVDNGRVATPMHRSVLDAVEMTEKGYSAAEIKKILGSVVLLAVRGHHYFKEICLSLFIVRPDFTLAIAYGSDLVCSRHCQFWCFQHSCVPP